MDCHSEQAGLNLLNSRGITHAGHHSMVKAKRIVILDGYVAHGWFWLFRKGPAGFLARLLWFTVKRPRRLAPCRR